MLVCEVLAIIMVDNLEVLTRDDQGVVVVLVVDHQSVTTEEGKIAMRLIVNRYCRHISHCCQDYPGHLVYNPNHNYH